jgi:predicted nucleic acid-binding protein
MLVVDTDILIDIQRNHVPALEWFGGLTEQVTITGFTAMELIQDARNAREVALAQKLVAPFPVIWPSSADCEKARILFASQHRTHGIGLLDSLIASTVIGLGCELATHNVRHFRAVAGLRLLQPYAK